MKSPLEYAVACSVSEGLMLIPSEQESNTGIRAALWLWRDVRKDSQVSIFMSLESGFAQQEIEYARSKDGVPVSLGDRILRSETAGCHDCSGGSVRDWRAWRMGTARSYPIIEKRKGIS